VRRSTSTGSGGLPVFASTIPSGVTGMAPAIAALVALIWFAEGGPAR
jgi:hypothetical protein